VARFPVWQDERFAYYQACLECGDVHVEFLEKMASFGRMPKIGNEGSALEERKGNGQNDPGWERNVSPIRNFP